MKLNTAPIYNIRATKGFSLDDELRAWDGVHEDPTVQEPVNVKYSVNVTYSDLLDAAELRDFYAEQDQIASSADNAQERETFDSRLKYALQKASGPISVGRSKKPRVFCMSQLPRDMQKELADYVGFRGA